MSDISKIIDPSVILIISLIIITALIVVFGILFIPWKKKGKINKEKKRKYWYSSEEMDKLRDINKILTNDLRVLIKEEPVAEFIQVKTKWKLLFKVEDHVMYGESDIKPSKTQEQ